MRFANPSPEGRGCREAAGEGGREESLHPSPGPSGHPLPSGEGFAPKHFLIWRTTPPSQGHRPEAAKNHYRTHRDRDFYIALSHHSERNITNRDAMPLPLRNGNKERQNAHDQYRG